MAVTKAKKIEQVEALTKEFQGAKHGIVGTFAKMTVDKDFELRKAVRGAGGRYRVLKNTLAERAAKGSAIEDAVKDLAGVTSIAYTNGDPVALAKALSKYAKDNPEYVFKAGIVEGRVIAIKEIDALASMPSKEELYSKLLFLMTAPAQRLVTVMNAVGRDLAVVINQGVEKNKFGGAPAPSKLLRPQKRHRRKHRRNFGFPPLRKIGGGGWGTRRRLRFVAPTQAKAAWMGHPADVVTGGTKVWGRKLPGKIALSVVRGDPRALSGARSDTLETSETGTKSTQRITNRWTRKWQICSSWKNRS